MYLHLYILHTHYYHRKNTCKSLISWRHVKELYDMLQGFVMFSSVVCNVLLLNVGLSFSPCCSVHSIGCEAIELFVRHASLLRAPGWRRQDAASGWLRSGMHKSYKCFFGGLIPIILYRSPFWSKWLMWMIIFFFYRNDWSTVHLANNHQI